MSDPANPQPIPLDWNGRHHVLAVLTHLEEGLFVGEHEAFAQGRVEATRGRVGEQPYQRALLAFLDMQAGGAFSYGSNLSLRWLFTPEGRAAYLAILMRKGEAEHKGAPAPPDHTIARAVRRKAPALEAVFEEVLKRDFFEFWASVQPPEAAGALGGSAPLAPTDGTSPTPAG